MLVSQKRGAMLLVALGPVRGKIHDGNTPERHSMLLRHTGKQLLCPACGVALGCIRAASAKRSAALLHIPAALRLAAL